MSSNLFEKKKKRGILRNWRRYFTSEKKVGLVDNTASVIQYYTTEPLDLFSLMF